MTGEYVIWKFAMERPDMGISVVQMPQGARPISVGSIRGWLFVYAEVSVPVSKTMEDVSLLVLNTGTPFTWRDGMRFLGTARVMQKMVWHVYVIEDPPTSVPL